MPYITQEARERIEREINDESLLMPLNAGELNYVFTSLSHAYWENNGQNYQAFNDIIGALEGCKLELYRRKIAPYEDKKIEENGDVN